jgi:hypothetical protein
MIEKQDDKKFCICSKKDERKITELVMEPLMPLADQREEKPKVFSVFGENFWI